MDLRDTNELNEFLVLDAIRESGALTRGAIAERLRLSPASVSRIVRRLLDDGVVTESAGSSPGPGRNSGIISFNSRAATVISVDLGGTKCHGALADLTGEILKEDYRPTHGPDGPAAALVASIAALGAHADQEALPVRAVVVGVPAVPDPDTGLVTAGPNVQWSGFDLAGLIRQHVEEPFRIENDVTLAAIGQAWRGEGRSADGFVTLSIGTGIGGALVVNGMIVRGRHNAAGELGWLLTTREQLGAPPGELAGLEAVASGPALEQRARDLLEGGAESVLTRAGVTGAAIFSAAADGDAVARQVVDELLDHVAMAVVALVAVLDPERVILDGSVGRALEPYVDELASRVAPRVPAVPEMRFSRLGPNATVIGGIACALALHREQDAPRHLPRMRGDGAVALPDRPGGEGAATGEGVDVP
jgi:glucokinase